MKLNLTLEQLAYLKSLDSKKKKRKFLLDCLVECIEVGIEVIEPILVLPSGQEVIIC